MERIVSIVYGQVKGDGGIGPTISEDERWNKWMMQRRILRR